MTKKPRMGSDPLQKKDPLGWIEGGHAEKAGKQEKQSIQSQSSKPGNPSKPDLPGPPSNLETPRTPSKPPRGATTSKGLRPGWTRATFIVHEQTLQNLKAVAYWDRKELKRVVEEAFQSYLRGKRIDPILVEPE